MARLHIFADEAGKPQFQPPTARKQVFHCLYDLTALLRRGARSSRSTQRTCSIEIGDLRPRHPVVRQGADATELADRYLAGLALDDRLSPYQLRFRSRGI